MDGTKASANLAGLLALPGRIGEFSCMPPHNEEEKPLDPHELSTTGAKKQIGEFPANHPWGTPSHPIVIAMN
jgi:hypothetical protein